VQTELPVLIVDDDAVSRMILSRVLVSAGLRTEVMSSGVEALAWLSAGGRASLVLLDLVMPGLDGYEVLAQLRAMPSRASLPVLVLTALDGDAEVARAFREGADDFVRKPVGAAELVARVQSLLRMQGYVEALSRRERDARVVLELTQVLASTLELSAILYAVVQRLAAATRFDRCSVVLTQDDAPLGYVVASSDDRSVRDLPISLSKYPELRRVLETGQAYVVDDVARDPLFDSVRAGLPALGPKALACLPLMHDDRPLGVLVLRSSAPHPLSEQELWVAKAVAGATSIALRNARLLESLREENRATASARTRAERAIRELEPFADFFRAAGDGIVVLDRSGRVRYANPRACDILKSTHGMLEGSSFAELVEPRGRAEFAASLERLLEAGASSEPVRGDVQLAADSGDDADGDPRGRTLSVSAVAVSGEDELLLSFSDATEERRTRRELREMKEFLEHVIDSSADAIVSADEHGHMRLFSRAAEQLFGFGALEVLAHKKLGELFPAGVIEDMARLVTSPENGGPGRLEELVTEILAAGGRRIPVRISAAWIVEDERPRGWVIVLGDLREQLRLRESLDDAYEELRAREQAEMIAELAGAAAHELNQPLTSVLGYVEILRRKFRPQMGPSPELDALEREAERMAEIVRKVGTITRYETKDYVGGSRILDLERSSAARASRREAGGSSVPPAPSEGTT
jgi:PAS domain S-box-containing protein